MSTFLQHHVIFALTYVAFTAENGCPDLDSPNQQYYYIKDGESKKHHICAWLFINVNCSRKAFVMVNETVPSFVDKMEEEYGHSRWAYSKSDVPYTGSIFLNNNCTFVGYDKENYKGDTKEIKNSGLSNFGQYVKYLSANCTCTNETKPAQSGTNTEIIEDFIGVKEVVHDNHSSPKLFFIGLLLGFVFVMCTIMLIKYKDHYSPYFTRVAVNVRNHAPYVPMPAFSNPLYRNGDIDRLHPTMDLENGRY